MGKTGRYSQHENKSGLGMRATDATMDEFNLKFANGNRANGGNPTVRGC